MKHLAVASITLFPVDIPASHNLTFASIELLLLSNRRIVELKYEIRLIESVGPAILPVPISMENDTEQA